MALTCFKGEEGKKNQPWEYFKRADEDLPETTGDAADERPNGSTCLDITGDHNLYFWDAENHEWNL